jgi:hypothetical protein
MSESKAVTVVSERPPLAPRMLAGGILGADLGLFVLIAGTASGGDAAMVLFFASIPTIGLAGIAALATYIIQRRNSALNRLGRDLSNLSSLMERRLIGEEDYHVLKQRIIDDYRPQRLNTSAIVRSASWTGLIVSFALLLVAGASTWAPVAAFFGVLTMSGIGGAILGAAGTHIMHRIQSQQPNPGLPAGEPVEWQALGTRQALPSKK